MVPVSLPCRQCKVRLSFSLLPCPLRTRSSCWKCAEVLERSGSVEPAESKEGRKGEGGEKGELKAIWFPTIACTVWRGSGRAHLFGGVVSSNFCTLAIARITSSCDLFRNCIYLGVGKWRKWWRRCRGGTSATPFDGWWGTDAARIWRAGRGSRVEDYSDELAKRGGGGVLELNSVVGEV